MSSASKAARGAEPGTEPRISADPVRRTACRHCGLPVPASAGQSGARRADFCCRGCETVHALIAGSDLARFYELGGGQKIGELPPEPARHDWLAELEEKGRLGEGPQVRLVLDVQGLHCAACVWLLEQLWRRREGALGIRINPSLGQAELIYDRSRLPLGAYLHDVERVGYRFAPASKRRRAGDRGLLMRLGVCIALALNAMLFALAGYLGMTAADGPAYGLFRLLSAGLATAAVAVGGPVFFRGALAGLRQRVLHLDLPISAGILLAWGSSVWCALSGRGHGYFDTVTIFVALMLLGRYLQQTAVQRNRDYLLANDGAEHLRVRRFRRGRPESVPVREVAAGDRLLLASGDLLPVRARLEQGPQAFSLDWIQGESVPRSFAEGAEVPAGAFLAGRRPVAVRALATAEQSGLLRLLAAPQDPDAGVGAAGDLRGRGGFWAALNRAYVALVLLCAALAAGIWLIVDASRALEVTTAVLVVTCPCALGLATPLAFEMAVAGLRRLGVYVRSSTLLEKARHVGVVVFDKTGTVTWGRLRATALRVPAERQLGDVLYTMAQSSSHPVSRAIADLLGEGGAEYRFLGDLAVEETPGAGLQAERDGVRFRLGSSSFVFGEARPAGGQGLCLFSRNGHVEACYQLEEDLRAGARAEIEALQQRGYEVHLLSGDRGRNVARVAERIGLAPERARGDLSPEAKAEIVGALDRTRAPVMMVGDGLNDAPAFAAAYCAGTPALDSPVMPGHADFFFRGGESGAVSAVLGTSRRLRSVVVTNLWLAGLYNGLALPLCFAGLMSPLLCAVLMPLSSLALVGHTGLRLRRV